VPEYNQHRDDGPCGQHLVANSSIVARQTRPHRQAIDAAAKGDGGKWGPAKGDRQKGGGGIIRLKRALFLHGLTTITR